MSRALSKEASLIVSFKPIFFVIDFNLIGA